MQTTSRDSIIIRASPNIVTNPDHLDSLSLFRPSSLAKHYARHLMRLMQSSDAFNPANLHCALISCTSIPLMESLMRNRNILLSLVVIFDRLDSHQQKIANGPSFAERKFALYFSTLFAFPITVEIMLCHKIFCYSRDASDFTWTDIKSYHIFLSSSE